MATRIAGDVLHEGGDPLVATLGVSGVAALVASVAAGEAAERVTTQAPASGKPLVTLPVSTRADVAAAADVARAAQRAWAARPVRDRAAVLRRVHDLVLDRRSLICDVIQLESGKARKDAYEEVADVALAARYAAAVAPRALAPRRRRGLFPGLTSAYELRHPKGLVGVISPWNYPFTLAASDALPAFVAGNAVLHKPDIHCVLTALLARSLALRAGLPAGLWQIVVGDGPVVGTAVLDQADYASFTGSTATGRLVAARMGVRLRGVSLELGGKNPLLVLADADLDRAAAGAVRACFANAGQLCVAMERVYVAAPIHDAMVARLVARTRALRLGTALDFSYDVGSLQSQQQLDKTDRHVQDAVEKGATVLVGGHARPDIGPYVFEPTLLAGVRPGMLVHDGETFGPVASVYRVDTDDEAVAAANATPYGLNASVWTRDRRRGLAVARRLAYGTVNVNEGYAASWGSHDLPLGGMKDSGLGRRHGREGITRYTEVQGVAVQRGLPVAPPGRMGYERFTGLMTTMLRALERTGRP